MITFDLTKNVFVIPGGMSQRVKPAPDRKYFAAKRVWEAPRHPANNKFLKGNFVERDFEPTAWAALHEEQKSSFDAVPVPQWPDRVYDHLKEEWFDLLPHQRDALNKAWGLTQFAFFHGMGSGKSLTMLLLWDAMFEAGLIDEAWAIVPNSLIGNWREQIARWTPWNKDKISAYGILSLSAGNLPKRLVLSAHKRLAVGIDESQRIKNSRAVRSKVMHSIGQACGFRYCLTGTSVTKGMEDLYSQYYFLDPMIIGHKSFFTFRNRYCQMGGFENKQIVGYINSNELMGLLAPFTDVVVDPVKLPPMTPENREVHLSPEQKRLLKELKDQMETEMAGERLTVDNALAYYTRGAQIVGGFFPVGEGRVARLEANPKLAELMEIIEDTDYKVVVFCRFKAEQRLVIDALVEKGIGVTWIMANDPHLQANVEAFQNRDDCRVMVATYAMGSVGHTLTAARVLVKYSGTFNFEDEAQSEKRIHRIGQQHATKSIRIMAKCKIDAAMLATSQGKATIADFVNNSLRTNPRSLTGLLDYE